MYIYLTLTSDRVVPSLVKCTFVNDCELVCDELFCERDNSLTLLW